MDRDAFGRRFVLSPFQSASATTGAIQGVWIAGDEEVIWHWTHGPAGSYVSGYTVQNKAMTKLTECYDTEG